MRAADVTKRCALLCFKCYACCNDATARLVAETSRNVTYNCSDRAPGGFAAQCAWDGRYYCACASYARETCGARCGDAAWSKGACDSCGGLLQTVPGSG